jgi:hypothetical protein
VENVEPKRTLWMDVAAILMLCLLSVVTYRHIVLSNRILAGGDAYTYFYPYREYAAEALRSGQLPLWNPYLFLGVPYLANPQAAVFYPLNWPLVWLSAPKLVAWSIVIHVALAAAFAYLYARRSLRLSPLPAYLGASAYALGGFLSGQAEHINQLNVSAWFPLLLYLWDAGHPVPNNDLSGEPVRSNDLSRSSPAHRRGASGLAILALGIVLGLGLLAGHTQSSYISVFGLGLYALVPLLGDAYRAVRARAGIGASLRQAGRAALDLAVAALLAAGLAAVQLLPSLELSRYSIRSSGLSYREAVAFSLRPLPRLLRYTFLPPWGRNLSGAFGGSYFTEFLAYVGVVPLLLIAAWGIAWLLAWVVGRKGGHAESLHEVSPGMPAVRLLVLAAAGPLLALGLYDPLYWVLYKAVPGFDLFRVPARWLLLYAFAVPMLAALAMQRLWMGIQGVRLRAHPPRAWRGRLSAAGLLLAATTTGELLWAACALPFSDPTAPEAWSALRTAPAHILAAQAEEVAPGRFLSMSDILFDPGDLAEIQAVFAGQLSPQAIYDDIVAAKRKEILAPNLPLAWRAYAVDGYDGGLLPLARYVQLQRLFLAPDEILTDGRLREGLDEIPPARLLSLLGVRYVITDKVHDAWIDDVFYDLSLDAALTSDAAEAGTTDRIVREDVPAFEATGMGLLSYLEGAGDVADATPVARIDLKTVDGQALSFFLRAGMDTAEGIYSGDVRHSQAPMGTAWPDRPEGSDYLARLDWPTPARIARLEIAVLPLEGAAELTLHVRGCTLIDARDGSNVPVLLSTAGDYRLVHSGDVKIYEVRDALPRAYVVHKTRVIADDEVALAAMADPAFQPGQETILAAGEALQEAPSTLATVQVSAYAPEEIAIQATLDAPGYLVLSDTWYPGWHATVDGERAVIERANTMFRAVYLPAGTHEVHFVYQPISFYAGTAASGLALVGTASAAIWLLRRRGASTHEPGR